MRCRRDECEVGRVIDFNAVAPKNIKQIKPLLFDVFLPFRVYLGFPLLRPVCENER